MNFKLNNIYLRTLTSHSQFTYKFSCLQIFRKKNIALSKNSLFKEHIALHQNKRLDGMI